MVARQDSDKASKNLLRQEQLNGHDPPQADLPRPVDDTHAAFMQHRVGIALNWSDTDACETRKDAKGPT